MLKAVKFNLNFKKVFTLDYKEIDLGFSITLYKDLELELTLA
jgi:hypothetical protein